MGVTGRISSVSIAVSADENIGGYKSGSSADHSTQVATHGRTAHRAGNGAKQWRAVGQIGSSCYRASGNGDGDTLADRCATGVFDQIGFWAAAEHLGQLLSATAARLMATTAAAVFNFDHSLRAFQRTDDALDCAGFPLHAYHRRSGAVSSKGRSFAATASRARNIRERTVPMGQSMMPAISS